MKIRTTLLKKLMISMTACALVMPAAYVQAQEAVTEISTEATEEEFGTVTDVMGREVTVKKNPEKVIAIPWPWPSFIFAVDGSADKICNMSATSLASYKNCMFQILAPGLDDSDGGYIDDSNKNAGIFGTPNVEELAKINPDLVVIYEREADQLLPILEAANIPTVAFGFGGLEDLQSGMKILGEIFGEDAAKNAETITNWHHEAQDLMNERTKDLTDEEKPTCIHLYDANLKVSSSKFVTNMEEMAGAIDVTVQDPSVISGNGTISFEQLLMWDPDIIYLGNFSDHTPDEIYNNEMAGQDWSQLTAVKNHHVYKVPMGLYRWDAPNTEAHLLLEWHAKIQQPELFQDIDLEADVQNFYQTLFQHDVTEDEMAMIFHDDLNAQSEPVR